MMFSRNRSRRALQGGQEVIEASLILVPLFGLTFLLLDLCMAIFVQSTLQNAVRQGVRYAITGANNFGPCQDDSIKQVVKNNALGFLTPPAGAATIHVHWISPGGGLANNNPGNIVGVTVEGLPWTPWAPYQHSRASVHIWARAYDEMENIPAPYPCISHLE